jgi:hypothetical protein
MIQDDNDKVRRNLVVASSAIIIFAWLGLNETILFERLFGNQVTTISWRVSILSIAILAYLSLRYRFADSTIKDYGRLIGEWCEILANNTDRRIHSIFKKFSRTQKDVAIFSPKLSDYVNDQISDTAFGEKRDWHLISLQHTSIQPKDTWSGELGMAIDLGDNDGYSSKRVGGNKVEYSFEGYERYRLITVSLLRLVTYTKGAIDFIAPILLALLAFIVLIIRLVNDFGIYY